jgi:hypothetical protein
VGNVKENSIEDIMNNDKMRELRLLMLSDKKSDMCLKCYNMEDLGIKSHRLRHNDTFKNHFDIIKNTDADGKIEPNLKFVDVRFSNICNLKCRMCYSGLSSSIAAEENKKIIYLKSLPDYDIFEKQGITKVLHSGDFLDGFKILAVSAIKCTPAKTIISALVLIALVYFLTANITLSSSSIGLKYVQPAESVHCSTASYTEVGTRYAEVLPTLIFTFAVFEVVRRGHGATPVISTV